MQLDMAQVHVTDMIRDGPVLHDSDIEQLKAFAEHSTLHVRTPCGLLLPVSNIESSMPVLSECLCSESIPLKSGVHMSRQNFNLLAGGLCQCVILPQR
jgi:hypothetical protein